MKRIVCLVTLLLSAACTLFAQQDVKELVKTLNDVNTKKVIVVAHRGDWRNAPENSLQAFKN